MSSHSDGGWAYFPKELLLKIFCMAADTDKRLLHPFVQVCSQWNKIIKTDLIEDYDSYLEDVKINLKFTKVVNRNVVVNNLFTCFYLAEYDEDFLFWPKQATDNMVYCSGVQGNYQIISYKITAEYIDYVKLSDNNYLEKPSDCYRSVYQEYNDVSPFSGSNSNQTELIKKNTYPVFKKSLYTVCLYYIDPNTPKCDRLTFVANPIRYHFNTNRKLNYATISQNNKYLVFAFSGLIEVYRLPESHSSVSINLNDLEPCFHRQQPSVVKYLSIDDNAHVLFLKSLRLGGLSIINLITGEELEFPHYRVDLNMSSQVNDHIVLLNGYKETIVYGLPQKNRNLIASHERKLLKESEIDTSRTNNTEEDYLSKIKKLKIIPDEVPIWNYFENHINANLEEVVPVNNILPTDAPGCFIGLIKGYSFNGKLESIFSGGTSDRSIDLVLLISRSYPLELNQLDGKYLEDFTEEILQEDAEVHYGGQWNGLKDEEIDISANEPGILNYEDDDSSDDFSSLSSQFVVVPLIFNVQHLSRSSLLSISNDGKRFAILINNLLFVMNISSVSILLILRKFLEGTFETLDLLKVFNVYTDPNDFRLELAATLPSSSRASSLASKLNEGSGFLGANIYMIDELLELPEFKEQHKIFNNNNSAIDSDDEDDELLSDDLATSDTESLLNGDDARTRGRNLQAGLGLRNVEHKPQLVWQGNDKIVINFNGNLHVLLSLESIFDN